MAVTEHLHRRLVWIFAPTMCAAVIGLPLAVRALVPFTDSGFVPAAPGLVQIGLGVALGVVGVVIQVRALVHFRRGLEPVAGPVWLPRPVRRAVLRRRPVPEEFRSRVPGWLAAHRAMLPSFAGSTLWLPTTFLVFQAGDTVRGLVVSVVVTVVILLVVGGALAGWAVLLRRARRRYAA